MRCLNVTPAAASAELTIAASRISEKGRTFDSWSDLTFSEIHRRVAWGMVGLLAGQQLDCAITNPCPKETDICLSQVAQSTYGFPSAIRFRFNFPLRIPFIPDMLLRAALNSAQAKCVAQRSRDAELLPDLLSRITVEGSKPVK